MANKTLAVRPVRRADRGVSLFIMAVGMVGMLGICGLGLDLASFYVVRSEAQRAADSAALAGAHIFVLSGCTANSGDSCASSTVEAAATQEAESVGNQNQVGGQSPAIVDADISFDTSHPGDPIITVHVQRTAAHGNPVPTYFAQILSVSHVDVAASASAEAYNPSGGGSSVPVCLTCIKPFIIPNCDPQRVVSGSNANANKNCADGSGYDSYFFDQTTGEVLNPDVWPSGIIGEPYSMHYAAGPGNYQTIDLGQGNGGSALANAIESCYPSDFGCGDSVTLVPGKKVGPVTSAVATLIHQSQNCSSTSGQDTIVFSSGSVPPFIITGGTDNPDSSLIGQTITSSSSIITVPMYDGSTTGHGSNTTFTIKGFMQVFVTYACHSGSDDIVYSDIMNIVGCGTGASGCNSGSTAGSTGSGFVSGGGASAVPIRLVKTSTGS